MNTFDLIRWLTIFILDIFGNFEKANVYKIYDTSMDDTLQTQETRINNTIKSIDTKHSLF